VICKYCEFLFYSSVSSTEYSTNVYWINKRKNNSLFQNLTAFFIKVVWERSTKKSFSNIFFGKEEGRLKRAKSILFSAYENYCFKLCLITWAMSQIVGLLYFKYIFVLQADLSSFPPPHLMLIGFSLLFNLLHKYHSKKKKNYSQSCHINFH
jgi:hypothetical protein